MRQCAYEVDPLFIDKVRDVVGLYLNPPERAAVLCVDEKSQIQALDRTAPIFPMMPGVPARASHDYKRAGTSNLYAALDLASGKVIGSLHSRHRAIEFRKFLATIDRQVPASLDVQRADHQEPAPQHPPDRPRTQRRHPRLDQYLERKPPALRLDQNRRPDPRIHRQILHAH